MKRKLEKQLKPKQRKPKKRKRRREKHPPTARKRPRICTPLSLHDALHKHTSIATVLIKIICEYDDHLTQGYEIPKDASPYVRMVCEEIVQELGVKAKPRNAPVFRLLSCSKYRHWSMNGGFEFGYCQRWDMVSCDLEHVNTTAADHQRIIRVLGEKFLCSSRWDSSAGQHKQLVCGMRSPGIDRFVNSLQTRVNWNDPRNLPTDAQCTVVFWMVKAFQRDSMWNGATNIMRDVLNRLRSITRLSRK